MGSDLYLRIPPPLDLTDRLSFRLTFAMNFCNPADRGGVMRLRGVRTFTHSGKSVCRHKRCLSTFGRGAAACVQALRLKAVAIVYVRFLNSRATSGLPAARYHLVHGLPMNANYDLSASTAAAIASMSVGCTTGACTPRSALSSPADAANFHDRT
jgi:hypothetical protein